MHIGKFYGTLFSKESSLSLDGDGKGHGDGIISIGMTTGNGSNITGINYCDFVCDDYDSIYSITEEELPFILLELAIESLHI